MKYFLVNHFGIHLPLLFEEQTIKTTNVNF